MDFEKEWFSTEPIPPKETIEEEEIELEEDESDILEEDLTEETGIYNSPTDYNTDASDILEQSTFHEDFEEKGFGSISIAAMEDWLGCEITGEITGQVKSMRKYYKDVTSVLFTLGGSPVIKKLQAKIGVAQDGYLGIETSKALQRFLNKNGAKLEVDGYWGPETSKAFQKYLNKMI